MKRTHHMVTRQVDDAGHDTGERLPDELAEQIASHKRISSAIRQAYATEPTTNKLSFLGQRVLARARTTPGPGRLAHSFNLLACLFAFPRNVIKECARHPGWSGAVATVAIAAIVGALAFHRSPAPAPRQYESFVIHQTRDGNGFVRYFNYKEVDSNEIQENSS